MAGRAGAVRFFRTVLALQALSILITHTHWVYAVPHDCTVKDSSNYVFDFTPLIKKDGTDWLGKNAIGTTSYYFNFCDNVVGTNCLAQSSPTYQKGTVTCTALADLSSYEWVPPDANGVILLKYSKSPYSVIYRITCGSSEPTETLVATSSNTYTFSFTTPLACKSASTATQARTRSRTKTRTRSKLRTRSRSKNKTRSRTRSKTRTRTKIKTKTRTKQGTKSRSRSPGASLSNSQSPTSTQWPAPPFAGTYAVTYSTGNTDCLSRLSPRYNVSTIPDINHSSSQDIPVLLTPAPNDPSPDLDLLDGTLRLDPEHRQLSNLLGTFDVQGDSLECTGSADNRLSSAKGSTTLLSMNCALMAQPDIKCAAKMACQDCSQAFSSQEQESGLVIGLGVTIGAVGMVIALGLVYVHFPAPTPQPASSINERSAYQPTSESTKSPGSKQQSRYGSLTNV